MQCDGVIPRIATKNPDMSGVGLQDAEQDPNGGCLSRPVGAQEAVDLSLTDLEVQTVEGVHAPEVLMQIFDVNDGGHPNPLSLDCRLTRVAPRAD